MQEKEASTCDNHSSAVQKRYRDVGRSSAAYFGGAHAAVCVESRVAFESTGTLGTLEPAVDRGPSCKLVAGRERERGLCFSQLT